jgi:hypothetical protein
MTVQEFIDVTSHLPEEKHHWAWLQKRYDLALAMDLFCWVRSRGGHVTLREVSTRGPQWARQKEVALRAFLRLQAEGYGTTTRSRRSGPETVSFVARPEVRS